MLFEPDFKTVSVNVGFPPLKVGPSACVSITTIHTESLFMQAPGHTSPHMKAHALSLGVHPMPWNTG